MEPSPELFEALRREEVEDARKLTPAQKLALSGDLFDYACHITLCGIRWQNPGVSDDEALNILRKRLDLARRTESRL